MSVVNVLDPMLERYDQSELLSLIEGDLDVSDPRAAAALRARLVKDPQVASMVESMMRDRASLRSFEEPALPQDFLSEIETMLSRPMLYEPVADVVMAKPGEFRRRQQRQSRKLRLGRLAAAAALLLASTGGGWALIRAYNGDWAKSDSDLQASTNSFTSVANGEGLAVGPRGSRSTNRPAPGTIAEVSRDDLGPGAVHHNRPPRHIRSDAAPAMANARATAANATDASDTIPATTEPMTLAADFAVVMQSPSPTIAESAVSGVIADLGERAALVRNFSYVEAQRLNEEYRMAHGGSSMRRGGDAPPVVAMAPGMNDTRETMITRSELSALARNVREQLRTHGGAGDAAFKSSADTDFGGRQGIIAGTERLAPSLEQQLDFSSRGASYTLAVPASEIVSLLEHLALNDPTGNYVMMLRMLPATTPHVERQEDGTAGTRTGSKPPLTASVATTLDWLTEGPLVRQAMQRLAQTRGDTIVLVPVILK